MKMRFLGGLAGAALAMSGFVAPAAAAPIVQQWDLFNHPDGGAAAPFYGLRLDGLFTGNSGHVWTFDFENGGDSTVQMTLTTDDVTGKSSLNIQGIVSGGRDVGTEYASGSFGSWYLDFTYRDFVVPGAPGDDHLPVEVTNSSDQNSGFIAPLFDVGSTAIDESLQNSGADLLNLGLVINLVDKSNSQYTFLYGHPGDPGRCGGHPECDGRVEGHGWLDHSVNYNESTKSHISASDFLFTGTVTPVPVPAALPLMASVMIGFGVLGAVRRRRKSSP